jgi:hypothetical protein
VLGDDVAVNPLAEEYVLIDIKMRLDITILIPFPKNFIEPVKGDGGEEKQIFPDARERM